jgi:hypothetical protein
MKTRNMIRMENSLEIKKEEQEIEEQEIEDSEEEYSQDLTIDMFKKYYHMIPYTNYISKQVYTISIPYLFWFILHYCSAHLYTSYCVPLSMSGLLWSPLLISSPHCKAFRWVLHNGGNSLDSMWILIGTWLSFTVLKHWDTNKKE